MNFPQIVQYGLSGITVGSIYAIVAVGFNIIYNTTGIINFAQGEFLIVGALTAISLYQIVPLWLAIVLAVVVTAILGGLIEIVFIRPARNASVLRLIVITIGLSILMREAMKHIWGTWCASCRTSPAQRGRESSSSTRVSLLRCCGCWASAPSSSPD